MKVVIYFCGTDENGQSFTEDTNYITESGAKILLVQGCAHEKVCDSGISPDLNAFAKRFVANAFIMDGEHLKLNQDDKTLEEVGTAFYPKPAKEVLELDKIDHITLCGYSRGAVTCFEVAKQLKKLNPNLKLDIIANQPVPGNSYELPGTNAASISDCRDLTNLDKATIILGAYTAASQEYKINCQPHLSENDDLSAYKTSYVLVNQPHCELYLMADHQESENPKQSTNTEMYLYKKKNHTYSYFKNGQEFTLELKEKTVKRLSLNFISDDTNLIPCKDVTTRNYFLAQMPAKSGKLVYVNSVGNTEQLTKEINAYSLSLKFSAMQMNPNEVGEYTVSSSSHFDGILQDSLRDNTDSIKNFFHRAFFSQIVPKLPEPPELIVIPREHHNEWGPNSNYGFEHLHLKIAESLQLDKGIIATKQENIRDTYKKYESMGPALFPQKTELQETFGLSKDEMYKYLDPYHPKPFLRRGYTLFAEESLINWWNRYEKNASYFSSDETRELVKTIKETKFDDIDQLQQLLAHCDKWLFIKANSSSSRYYNVLALRNNLYHAIIDHCDVKNEKSAELVQLCENIHSKIGLINRWKEGSAAASFFQSKATDELDLAFKNYAISKPSFENDSKLNDALQTWLDQKTNGTSKRYDLVVSLKLELENCIQQEVPKNRVEI
jgi:hypothetical protein